MFEYNFSCFPTLETKCLRNVFFFNKKIKILPKFLRLVVQHRARSPVSQPPELPLDAAVHLLSSESEK
jgi:hypothetical protein